jgi:hypothetical protein
LGRRIELPTQSPAWEGWILIPSPSYFEGGGNF